MLIEYFKQYIKLKRGISDSAVAHYVTGLNSINSLLVKYNFPIKNVFYVQSIEELDKINMFLSNNDEFMTKDTVGHHMYSVAFNHFYCFAKEDSTFFSNNIKALDVVIPLPEQITIESTVWRRNQILISQAIQGAHYQCEHNQSHNTFISMATGEAYMEGHHLIPLKFQSEFNVSIDVYANIVCLCPICHRLMHYGTDKEREYAAEMLFDFRQDRLRNSGIELSKNDFIQLIKQSEVSNGDQVIIPLEEHEIWFTQTHFAEIQELIKLSDEVKTTGNTVAPVAESSDDDESEKAGLSVYSGYIGKTISRKDGFLGTITAVDNDFIHVDVIKGDRAGRQTKIQLSFVLKNNSVYKIE